MKTKYLMIDAYHIILNNNANLLNKLNSKSIFNKYRIPKKYQKIIVKLDKNTLKTDVLNKRKDRITNGYEISTYAPFSLVKTDEMVRGINHLRDDQIICGMAEEVEACDVIDFYQGLNKLDKNIDYLKAVNEILSPCIDLNMTMFNCLKRVKIFDRYNI